MRDYDKEPLIFKSYEEFFQSKAYIWILSIIAAMLSAFVAFFIQDIFEKGWDAGKIEYINTIKDNILFVAVAIIFAIIDLFICIKFFKSMNSKIKLKNNTIDFIKNDELEHTSEISSDIYRSCSPIASVSIISLKLKRSIDIVLIIIVSISLFLKPVLLIS